MPYSQNPPPQGIRNANRHLLTHNTSLPNGSRVMNNNPKSIVDKLNRGIYFCFTADKTAKKNLGNVLNGLSKRAADTTATP